MQMPIWFFDNGGWQNSRLARASMQADAYLCAPGPSLVPVAAEPGVYVAALTKAYPAVMPHLWVGLDEPECYDRRLWWEGFIKITNGGYRDRAVERVPVRNLPNVYFADLLPISIERMFVEGRDDFVVFDPQHSLGLALHVLLMLGAKKIRLVGFDLQSVAGQDYHRTARKVLSPELRRRNQVLFDEQLFFLSRFAALALEHGVEVISCTPGSRLNASMPFVPLEEALRLSRARVPPPGTIMHCRELTTHKPFTGVATELSTRPRLSAN
jgi:hypothetical protein